MANVKSAPDNTAENPRPYEAPVGPLQLRKICDDNDDGNRNWFVTLAYRDLALVTAAYTHGLRMTPEPGGGRSQVEARVRQEATSKRHRDEADAAAKIEQGAAAAAPEAVAATLLTAGFEKAVLAVDDTLRREPTVAVMRSTAEAGSPALDENSPPMVIARMAGLRREPRARERAPKAEPAAAGPPLNANFCTFATWSSLTLGRDIRNVRLPRRFDRISGLRFRHTATALVIEARKTNRMELSRLLGLGQRVVLWEVGTGLYTLFLGHAELDELPAVQALNFNDFKGQRGFADEATQELAEKIQSWLTKMVRPKGAAGLMQLRSKDLALGLASYHLARRAAIEGGEEQTHRRWVAELILRGNLLIGSYEQRKVDQLLKYPVEEFASDFFLEHSGIKAMERSGEGRWRRRLHQRVRKELTNVPELWGRFFTDQILVFWAGDELLRLGRDLPLPPAATSFVPDDLRDIQDDWLRTLLCRYDHSYGNGHGTQSRIWSVFDDRMNYIVNFMRSRAQTPGLWQHPLDPSEEGDLRMGSTPRSANDAHR